jgi:flagellar biosynthesis component FlhA
MNFLKWLFSCVAAICMVAFIAAFLGAIETCPMAIIVFLGAVVAGAGAWAAWSIRSLET